MAFNFSHSIDKTSMLNIKSLPDVAVHHTALDALTLQWVGMDEVTDYWFKVEHQESLHAHNAVVIDQKN